VQDLHERLSDQGYAILDGQDSNSLVAAALGQAGESVLLSPRDALDADPWSLSGRYGLSVFPWHTDGAVSTRAPDIIILRAVRCSKQTYTELLDPPSGTLDALQNTVLRVKNRGGHARYLPAVVSGQDGQKKVRWDSRTCEPLKGIAMQEVEQLPATVRIDWVEGRLLLINNRRLLHRRPTVAQGSDRLLERTYVWRA
jgi:hypothetical protein